MMKLEGISTTPANPELVETECKEISGLDLLGLRSAAETVSGGLLNGITTVTATVRYVSLLAWIVKRYADLGGMDDYTHFLRFAKKVEAAFAMGNLLADRSIPGLIGADGGRKRVDETTDSLTLGALVKTPAVGIYSAPARDLGVLWNRSQIPGLTNERGKAIADTVATVVEDLPVVAEINLDDPEQSVLRTGLESLGQRFPLRQPEGLERQLLINALMPSEPNRSDVSRMATYCLILQMISNANIAIRESDVLKNVLCASLDDVPPVLHSAYNGWARFVVRDMLVASHETAVSLVCRHLEEWDQHDRRVDMNTVVRAITDDLDQGLADVAFDLDGSSRIDQLYTAVMDRIGPSRTTGPIRRWDGDLLESDIAASAVASQGINATSALLPIAWLLASERHRLDGQPFGALAASEGIAGQIRIGVYSIICPEIERWRSDRRTIREVVAELIRRSVDQHLRVAWSRLAREPWKDVSALTSDGSEWIYIKRLRAGRSASRLDQAIGWLRQLGLVANAGLTSEGQNLLEDRLDILSRSEQSES